MPVVEVTFEYSLAFDTSVFTHLRTSQSYVLTKMSDYFRQNQRLPALPAMAIFEAKWGVEKEFARKEISSEKYAYYIQKITELAEIHQVLPFDQKAAEIAAFVYARLSKSDQNKHWEDLFIMATAIAHNHGLITQNTKDTKLLASHLPDEMILQLAVWKS